MAKLISREAAPAPATMRATQRPLSASVSAMPSVNTTPSTAAKNQPARLAPVTEKTSAWLMVSNESAKAAPTAAITAPIEIQAPVYSSHCGGCQSLATSATPTPTSVTTTPWPSEKKSPHQRERLERVKPSMATK